MLDKVKIITLLLEEFFFFFGKAGGLVWTEMGWDNRRGGCRPCSSGVPLGALAAV